LPHGRAREGSVMVRGRGESRGGRSGALQRAFPSCTNATTEEADDAAEQLDDEASGRGRRG